MQNKNKQNNPYQFDIKTVKLSECSPDDIRMNMAKKVLAQSDVIVLDCLDGKLNFARKAYDESGLVRDLIDTQKEWIAGHTVREVSDELEDLYMK